MTTPRVMTKEQMIVALKGGRTLCLETSREDAEPPELADLWALEREGLVEASLIEFYPRFTLFKFRWRGKNEPPH